MIDTSSLRSLVGKHVVGQDGQKIGKIADVYESTDGGGGTFATVTTGLFGGGSSFFPLEEAVLRDDQVVVPYTKDFVKDAPRVDDDEALSAPEEERLFTYYRLGGAAQQDAGERESADEHRTDEQVRDAQSGAAGARLRRHVGPGAGDVTATGEPVLPRHPVTAAHLAGQQDGDRQAETGHGNHVLPVEGTPADPAPRTP